MNITDEMVERAAKAMWDSTERALVARSALDEAEPWEEATDMHVEYQEYARAALTAALGDVEPLEDVLDHIDGAAEVTIRLVDLSVNHTGYMCTVTRCGDQYDGYGVIRSEAIRDAITNLKGDQA